MATDLRTLQKRARDKEYKLRKKGASEQEIARVSPRKDWAVVSSMTPKEIAAYSKQLESFNNRSNRLVVLQSGETIPYKMFSEIKAEARKHNERVRRERDRVNALSGLPGAVQTVQQRLYTHGRYNFTTGEFTAPRGSVLGALTELPVTTMQLPGSRVTAQRRLKTLKEMNSRTFAKYRAMQRENMAKILEFFGEYKTAEVVRNMRRDNFDLLSSRTNVWDLLTVVYPERDAAGKPMFQFHEDEQQLITGGAVQLIREAAMIGLDEAGTAKRRERYARQDAEDATTMTRAERAASRDIVKKAAEVGTAPKTVRAAKRSGKRYRRR